MEELDKLKDEIINEINLKKIISEGDLTLKEVKEDGTKRYMINNISKIVKKKRNNI